MPQSLAARARYVGGYLLVVLYLLLLLPAHMPVINRMSGDAGFYAYAGQQLNAGRVLYKEIWDQKLPTVYYAHALWFRIFPDNRWSLYLLDVLMTLTLLATIFFILRNLKMEEHFWVIGILFLTVYRVFPSFTAGNLSEHFYLLFFFLSVYLLTGEESRVRYSLAGAVFAPLLMLKQPYVLPTAVMLWFFRREVLRHWRSFGAGLLCVLAVYLWILVRALPESFDATILFNMAKAGGHQWGIVDAVYRLSVMTGVGPGRQFLLMCIAVLCTRNRWRVPCLAFSGSLLLILLISPELYQHYLVMLVMPVMAGAILLLASEKEHPYHQVVAFLLVLSFLPLSFIFRNRVRYSLLAVHRVLVERNLAVSVPREVPLVLRYVKPSEDLILFPDCPQVYFLTRTHSPFRFPSLGGGVSTYYRDELRESIRRSPPTYVLLEEPVDKFERTFQLTPDMYALVPIESPLYRFVLKKQ